MERIWWKDDADFPLLMPSVHNFVLQKRFRKHLSCFPSISYIANAKMAWKSVSSVWLYWKLHYATLKDFQIVFELCATVRVLIRLSWSPNIMISCFYIKFVVWKKNQNDAPTIFCPLCVPPNKKTAVSRKNLAFCHKTELQIEEKIRKWIFLIFFSTTFYHKIMVQASIFPPLTQK